MAGFSTRRFERARFKATKGPSEKRRLERRLEERKRRNAGLPPAIPQPLTKPTTPTPKAPEERKEIRVKRHTRHINRKLKERQRMAERSGLKELTKFGRNGGTWQDAPPWARSPQEERARDHLLRASVKGTAEESTELSLDSRQKDPSITQEIPPWR